MGPRPAHAGALPARSQVRPGVVGAEALRALGEPGRRQASRGGRTKGLRLEGGGGELAPHQAASCEARRSTGKRLHRPEMPGPQEQRAAGAEMWVTAAWAPGMRGGVAGPRPSLDLVIPTTPPPHGLPWGEEKLLARLGPCVPQREPGPGPSPPDGWAEGQEAPPLLPNQTLENPERPLLPSRRKPCRRQASRPAPPPRAACAAGAGPAPFSSRRAAFLPPSLRPGDISFPPSLPRGFSQAEMGPWETRNQSRESPGHSLHHPPTYTRIRCRRSPEHVP